MLTVASWTLAGTALAAAGIGLLSVSWRKRRGFKAHQTLGGWLLIAANFYVLANAWGMEVGVYYGLLIFSLTAYGIVTAGIELRQAQTRTPREAALEPEDRPINWWRRIVKSLLAIVLFGHRLDRCRRRTRTLYAHASP